MRRSRFRPRAKRIAILAAAFGVGLVVADRMIGARLLADDGDAATTPATGPATSQAASRPASRPVVSPEVRAWLEGLRVAPPVTVAATLRQQFDVAGVARDTRIEIRGSARSATEFRHSAKDSVEVVADGKNVVRLDPRTREFRRDDLAGGVPDEVLAILRQQDPLLALAVEPDAARAMLPGSSIGIRQIDADTLGFDADGIHVTLRRGPDGRLASVGYDFGDALKARGATALKSALAIVEYASVEPKADETYKFDPPRDARDVGPSASSRPTTRGDKVPSTTAPADD